GIDAGRPAAAHLAERGALGHAAFAADHALQPDDLGGEGLVARHHRVEGARDVVHHTRTAGERQPDREVAVLRRLQGAEELAHPRIAAFRVAVPVAVAALAAGLLLFRRRGIHRVVGFGHGATP